MKLRELKEMAIKGGNFRPLADKFASDVKSYFERNRDKFKHIGDVETYQCFMYDSTMVLLDEERIIFVCAVEFTLIDPEAKKIDSVWLDSSYEGKNIYSKVLWFLRSREGVKKLILGDQHSEDTLKILRGGGLSSFTKTWINTKTGEQEAFSPDTLDKYYQNFNVDWKLVLESNAEGDEITEIVKNFRYSFVTDVTLGFVNSAYDWQIK